MRQFTEVLSSRSDVSCQSLLCAGPTITALQAGINIKKVAQIQRTGLDVRHELEPSTSCVHFKRFAQRKIMARSWADAVRTRIHANLNNNASAGETDYQLSNCCYGASRAGE
jgi:hypothetical protein